MSRINEALRRLGADDGPAAVIPQDSPFPVSEPGARPSRAPEVAPAVPPAGGESLLGTSPDAALLTLNTRWGERLASSREGDPVLVEQFRHLAGTLHTAQATNGLRLILVTSAGPGEGKTMTALNLAIVLSESYGKRVLLIDADLRQPSIANVFDIEGSVGLSTALKAPTDQKLALLPITPTLTLLPAGLPDPDPLSGLTSPRMRRILEEAVSRFDWVILDGPPSGPAAETGLLARMVQGTLLVVRAGHTQHASVERAIDGLGRDRILGVVLNGATVPGPGTYVYGAKGNEA